MPDIAIASRRMRNLLISGLKMETPAEVVRRLGALQAQDYAQAVWAIGLRTVGANLADVERAIADRRIVLTWALRGTLHAVPAEDARWMVRLSAPRVLARDKRMQRQLEIDGRLIAQCGLLIEGALKERKRMTRAELMELLEQAGISTKRQRGYHILWVLAQTGLICPGPLESKQQTFVLLDDWVPDARELSGEEALRELAVRYFTGHGPATLHDFGWWSGLTITEAKKAVAAADGVLFSGKIGGTEYWSGGEQGTDGAEAEVPEIALLAGYDEYLLGYRDRSAVLKPEHAPKIVPGGNGVYAPMLVVGGKIAGIWRRSIGKQGVELAVHPFEDSGVTEERVAGAARRYGEFLGLPLTRMEIRTE
jgi:hypothetical protein